MFLKYVRFQSIDTTRDGGLMVTSKDNQLPSRLRQQTARLVAAYHVLSTPFMTPQVASMIANDPYAPEIVSLMNLGVDYAVIDTVRQLASYLTPEKMLRWLEEDEALSVEMIADAFVYAKDQGQQIIESDADEYLADYLHCFYPNAVRACVRGGLSPSEYFYRRRQRVLQRRQLGRQRRHRWSCCVN